MVFYMLCGIPGSGKTMIASQLAKEQNAKLYSYDVVRYISQLSSFDTICSLIYQYIYHDLCNGFNVVYDAPNHKLKYRQEILNAISNISCNKTCIVLNTPFEECLKRNANRKSRLPDFVLYDMHNRFEPPTLDEGWDEIIVINNDKDIENLKNNIENNIKNLNLL